MSRKSSINNKCCFGGSNQCRNDVIVSFYSPGRIPHWGENRMNQHFRCENHVAAPMTGDYDIQYMNKTSRQILFAKACADNGAREMYQYLETHQ